MNTLGFSLYMLFLVSYFIHLPARITLLGIIRFDLVLVVLVVLMKVLQEKYSNESVENNCENKLKLLLITIVIITPFAEFPGSVLPENLITFLKAIVFFYFTVWYITTEKRLVTCLTVFVLCQTFRTLEPLYLNFTEGYWGYRGSMSGGNEFMYRLQGAPTDIINPNGLAFVILTLFPFIPYLMGKNFFWKLYAIAVAPLSFYALMLTGSRSGFLVMIILAIYSFKNSEKKMYYIIGAVVLVMFLSANMDDVFKDRYTSIYDSDTKNSGTTAGRLEGLSKDLEVGLKRPIFGFGLGTSSEASWNFGSSSLKSHNLFLEVFIELGLVGSVIFFIFLFSIYKNVFRERINFVGLDENNVFKIREAIASLFIVTLFFGFASYGLSGYIWYFIGGLSVSIENIMLNDLNERT